MTLREYFNLPTEEKLYTALNNINNGIKCEYDIYDLKYKYFRAAYSIIYNTFYIVMVIISDEEYITETTLKTRMVHIEDGFR